MTITGIKSSGTQATVQNTTTPVEGKIKGRSAGFLGLSPTVVKAVAVVGAVMAITVAVEAAHAYLKAPSQTSPSFQDFAPDFNQCGLPGTKFECIELNLLAGNEECASSGVGDIAFQVLKVSFKILTTLVALGTAGYGELQAGGGEGLSFSKFELPIE